MQNVLPADFADLERFADWVLPTEAARYEKRIASTMEQLQEFYDAAFPRIDDAMAYLEKYELGEMPEDATRLLWLFCALAHASFPVEVWRQPRVPDSGAASLTPVVQPAI
ncbi:MAG TPA: hypothetical protein VMS55_09235 [Myxococcota bacterium]|nr:hypothetical protein [Myxococcota bacterium]